MDSKIKAIVAIAIVVVVVAAAAVMLGGSDKTDDGNSDASKNKDSLGKALQKMDDETAPYPARLMILGNANCDDDITSADVEYIQGLIKNGYDYVDEFMADANYDGVIDEKDVELVKKLIDKDYAGEVNYINCNYKIRTYDMGAPLHLANILTQTLEMEMILAPEAIVATDYRAGDPNRNGGQSVFWKEYASVIDYSKIGNIGNHKTPNAEEIAAVAKEYGNGYLTVWFNSEYANNTGYLEDALEGTNVQILRLPSWENGATANGMLTAGYMFHNYGKAVEWVTWYDGVMKQITDKVSKLTDSERKKVLGSYLYTSESKNDGTYDIFKGDSGEYQNLLRLGIVDLVDNISLSGSKAWKETLTDEQFAQLCKKYGCDLMVGTVPGPFGAVGNESITPDYFKTIYNQRLAGMREYTDEDVDLFVYGWIWASGPMELSFLASVGNYMYGWDLPVEDIVNQGLKFMGIYGTGEYQYTYDTVKDVLFYAGD